MFGYFKSKKKRLDIELLHKKAKDNDIDAQYELGLAYYRGIHVKRDLEKSSYWLKKCNELSKEKGLKENSLS